MTRGAKFGIVSAIVIWGVIIYLVVNQVETPSVTASNARAAKANPGDAIGRRNLTYVWRNTDDMQDGVTMIKAGVLKTNPAALVRLIACVPPSGSGYVIKDRSIYSGTAEVLVVDGPEAGCKGVVPLSFVQ